MSHLGIDELTRKMLIRKLVFCEAMVSDKTVSWKLFKYMFHKKRNQH